MLELNIQPDPVDLARTTALLGATSKSVPVVLRRSVTRTIRWVHTRVVRAVSAATGIQQKRVRRKYTAMWIKRGDPPAAGIKIMDKPTPLIQLHPVRTERGIMFRKGGGQELRAGAFKATMPRGHVGIFKRRGRSRLPIGEQYENVVIPTAQTRINELRSEAADRLKLELTRNTDYMVRRMKR